MNGRRIDRILDPSYVNGLGAVSDERLREMREECEEEEGVLSYERRLIHARLDIIAAEQQRRTTGDSPRSLIDRLPEILTGSDPQTHRGSFPRLATPRVFDPPRRRIEKLVADDTLARLPDLSEAEIVRIQSTLENAEREVSDSRRAVLDVLDRLVGEVGRRVAPRT